MIHLKAENFDELINKELTLVDFYADWCGPCKMLAPVLEKLEDKVKIVKVNVDEHRDLAAKYSIMSIPNIIFFKNGEIMKSMVGFHNETELLDVINDLK